LVDVNFVNRWMEAGMTDRTPAELDQGPALRTIAMPADTNPNGDIFGGWLLSQMDLAGGVVAMRRAGGRCVTVGIEAMTFHKPVLIGDEVSCFGRIERVGRSSIRVRVESWVRRIGAGGTETMKVTEGVFTYVAIDAGRRPREVPEEGDPAW
jgi:acyl-CoA thioesterase YciA